MAARGPLPRILESRHREGHSDWGSDQRARRTPFLTSAKEDRCAVLPSYSLRGDLRLEDTGPTRKYKNLSGARVGEDVEKLELSSTVGGSAKCCNHFRKHFDPFSH